MKAKLKLEVGLLLRPSLRKYLDDCKFDNIIDDWEEAKGLLESTFYIYGNAKDLQIVKNDLIEQVG
jgi:hypothetical protein